MDTVEIFGVRLGYIYTSEADEKPIVTVANANDIKNGDIYFRYKGQSSTIRYPAHVSGDAEYRRLLAGAR
jgi:hypothetical protein